MLKNVIKLDSYEKYERLSTEEQGWKSTNTDSSLKKSSLNYIANIFY
jgi:hypothetical protein